MDMKSTLGKRVLYGLILASLMYTQRLTGQELVPDPSFEEYATCPMRLGNFASDLLLWSTPTLGSTDYFHGCSVAMGTPENFIGSQGVNFGQGYAGMYLFAPDDYREYVQTQLNEKLMEGEQYRISFYISLAENSDYAIREFGVCLSEKALLLPIKKELSTMQLHKVQDNRHTLIEITHPDFYRETRNWVAIHADFVAKGFENFLVIGNFRNNKQTRTYQTKKGAKKGAYYYVDMVMLTRVENHTERQQVDGTPEELHADIRLDEPHTISGILFEFDSDALQQSAKAGLDSLVNTIRKDVTLFLQIHGHTDNLGSAAYNKKLSLLRCAAVGNYMMEKGWPKERISWEGFGGSRPVSENDTEDGRRRNRRVEVVLSQLPFQPERGN